MIVTEKRKDVLGYEWKYKISNLWNLKNIITNKIIKQIYQKSNWYMYVTLYKNWSKQYRFHRLVALSFIKNTNNKPCINHIDGNKRNNIVDNLERCTHSENNYHFNKIWKFNFSEKRKAHLDLITQKTLTPVRQYDKRNNLIKEYKSIAEASIKTWISSANIQSCSSWNSKTAWWYIWNRI